MTTLARDVMQTKVLSVTPDMSLADLEDFLLAERIGGAPVVEDGLLVGVISRSDIVRTLSLARSITGLIAEGEPQSEFAPAETPEPLPGDFSQKLAARTVRDAMVVEPVVVPPNAPIAEVARLFVTRHLHRVVVTEGRTVRGVISTIDLVHLIAEGRLRDA